MKALCFCLIFLFPFQLASGQSCTPDPSIVGSDEVILPVFWTPGDQQFNLAVACIDEPYAQTLTIYPPAMLVAPGIGEFPLNSISISTTGAVINLPEGMGYSCNPPNCVFPSEELGCIQLEGVPSSANEVPDTLALRILSVLDVGFPLVVTLPDDFESGALIPLIVLPQGECISAVHERKKNLLDLKVFPNPFHSETTISLSVPVAGEYDLRLFDATGRLSHIEMILLEQGDNTLPFSASHLHEGIYQLEISRGHLQAITRTILLP